jgi:hypothetical protein
MSTPGHEVFGNYDYEFAAEQKRNPQKGLVQVMGERALKWAGVRVSRAGNWLRGMNEKRKSEKAERAQNGSLDVFYATADQQQRQDSKEARPVVGEAGLYRSNFSGEQPEVALDGAHQDELMRAATERARKALGELPVLTMSQPEQPGDVSQPSTNNPQRDERGFGDMSAEEDAALIARLNRAYNRPAEQPDRSGHTVPERRDDDTLVGTQGK